MIPFSHEEEERKRERERERSKSKFPPSLDKSSTGISGVKRETKAEIA